MLTSHPWLSVTLRYEEDIARLRHEIEARGGPPSHVGISALPPHGGVSQPAPPAIGHGPSNLFGGIMANPPGQGNPGLVPPSQDQQQPQQGLQQGPYQGNYPQPPVVNGMDPFSKALRHSPFGDWNTETDLRRLWTPGSNRVTRTR